MRTDFDAKSPMSNSQQTVAHRAFVRLGAGNPCFRLLLSGNKEPNHGFSKDTQASQDF